VSEGLEDGALGLSTGLVYPPQVNADTEEVRTLAARLEPYGRPFVAHIRSEGHAIWEALDEFADVGNEAGVPVHLSHYKLSGHEGHGKADRAYGFIELCRDRGIDFTAEQYPYTAGNTTLASVLPPWVHAGSREETMARLRDEDARERMRRDIWEWRIEGWNNNAGAIGWENVEVTDVDEGPNKGYEGMRVDEIAAEREVHPVDAVCDPRRGGTGGQHVRPRDGRGGRSGDHGERAGRRRLRRPVRRAAPSARLWHLSTSSRPLRPRGELLTLEEAVRKMTSLPARIVGLESKGLVREGMDADLTVFDPLAVGSDADYEDPAQYPRGIEHVLVNGEFVVSDGAVTGRTPGTAIRA
jgi:N-acyl-D-amino-acid deacylase